jgi:hypothetical protein
LHRRGCGSRGRQSLPHLGRAVRSTDPLPRPPGAQRSPGGLGSTGPLAPPAAACGRASVRAGRPRELLVSVLSAPPRSVVRITRPLIGVERRAEILVQVIRKALIRRVRHRRRCPAWPNSGGWQLATVGSRWPGPGPASGDEPGPVGPLGPSSAVIERIDSDFAAGVESEAGQSTRFRLRPPRMS